MPAKILRSAFKLHRATMVSPRSCAVSLRIIELKPGRKLRKKTPFQGGNTGSNPVGATTISMT